MKEQPLTFSLNFESYSIDFDVDVELSVEMTRGFNVKDTEFAFAAGEIWIRVARTRHLIVPCRNPGNLLMTLRELASTLRAPPSPVGIGRVIRRGSWGAWMHGYWDRVALDCSSANDEAIYALLSPLETMSSRQGHFAIYSYAGAATIEVATRPESGDPLYLWSDFDSDSAAHEAELLQREVHVAIRHALNAPR